MSEARAPAYLTVMSERHPARADAPPGGTRLTRTKRAKFRALDQVRVLADVVGECGRTVSAGSVGTVVARWAHGAAYEVEFAHPVQALATVERVLLEQLKQAG